MAPHDNPKILHFHDCADVGGALVRAAARQGLTWDYLSAEDVRPSNRPTNFLASKALTAKVIARNYRHIKAANLVHIHYANVVPNATMRPMPKRPYFLHLHGTDIRMIWATLRTKSRIQHYINGAAKVYYTNLDTRENAEEARPDAEYMPAFIEPERLTDWNPDTSGPPKIVFLSRWEEIKGVDKQLPLIKALRSALPHVRLEGLDWGNRAPDAAKLGVHLVPKMSHEDYVRWVASATVGIGQAMEMLGVSEFEAMAMGVPLGVLGHRIPRPDDGTTPPVFEGSVDDVVTQISEAIDDPVEASNKLGGAQWALDHHLPDPYVTKLREEYAATLGRS